MTLTAEDRKVAEMFGHDPADVLKFRAEAADRDAAIAELSPEEAHLCEMNAIDPVQYVEVKRADAQLTKLSAAERATIEAHVTDGDKIRMVATAKTLGYLR